ncbi:beta-1,2-xylosyltransferase XYXT1-like [Lolium rigidum]|uniref:beta-1,2-xylosyltransferase XYXT1-like n=1 Tax=Lolium rigidum TaxID=89674 RepID=UPI001F5D6F5E|nr:beta-1,2-xylosyltransferase XYXT1-like [Lolium rigidum]
MKVPVAVRSKSLKKSRGAPSCNLPLLLLIAGVMYVMIGKPFPSFLMGSRSFFNRAEEEFIPEPHVNCDFNSTRSDFCEIAGAIRIRGSTSEVFVVSPRRGATARDVFGPNSTWVAANATSWKMKPYTRKGESRIMNGIREFTVRLASADEALACDVMHEDVPAVLYSNGGYCGNYYHDFNDNIIPLFITTRHLGREVQLLVTQKQAWWFGKYGEIVDGLTRHEAVDLDGDTRVHCYRRVTVGLKSHKDLSIDPRRSPNNVSMVDFKRFLMWRYSLPREHAIRTEEDDEERRRPRLLIITRRSKRRFMNLEEIVAAAEKVGFEVTTSDLMTPPKKQDDEAVVDDSGQARMADASATVNAVDAMLAVHGSGLTNLVFLPMNAVVVQVVPLGQMEELAMDEYGVPPRDMNMRYLQYNITAEESTLSELYPRDHPVFMDPGPIHKQSWSLVDEIYLGKQDVRLDISRFRPVLQKALELLR